MFSKVFEGSSLKFGTSELLHLSEQILYLVLVQAIRVVILLQYQLDVLHQRLNLEHLQHRRGYLFGLFFDVLVDLLQVASQVGLQVLLEDL